MKRLEVGKKNRKDTLVVTLSMFGFLKYSHVFPDSGNATSF